MSSHDDWTSTTNDLTATLTTCAEYAKRGYHMANQNYTSMKEVLEEAKRQIRVCSHDLSKSLLEITEIESNLQSQLRAISDSFDSVSNDIKNDIVDKYDRLSLFSITLFGRTMAGKSTLMEILCDGDGTSIGKGAQRTTRDVRSYVWNGLEITDVPGIAAFEGEDDEQVAFASARQADLILFLLTDDAPQAAEAECLAEIRNLGKPVLGIMNVKAAIDPSMMKLSIRDINAAFNLNRLNGVRNQFIEFSKNYGQEWHDIFFAYTHLKSAYLSKQPAHSMYAEDLWKISRFSIVEKAIVDQIRTRGKFLRIKTFVDAVAKPSVDIFNMLIEQSMQNSEAGRTIISKRRKLQKWKSEYVDAGKQQIAFFCDNIKASLKRDLPGFIDDHYADSHAGKAWSEHINKLDIGAKCQKLFDSLAEECDIELREIAREIESEMKFSSMKFSPNSSIRMNHLIDGRRLTRWGFSIGSGVLSLGGLITGTLSGPVGWIAVGLGIAAMIIPNLFGDHDKDIREAKSKLEAQLLDDIEKMVNQIKQQLNKEFKTNLVEGCVTRAERNISAAVNTTFALSETQRNLASGLNNQFKQINKNLITEALTQIGAAGVGSQLIDMARLPGEYILIQVDQNTTIPVDIVKRLSIFLQEKILFVRSQAGDSPKTLICRILRQSDPNFDWKTVTVEEKPKIVHVPIGSLNPFGLKLKDLAQQLTDYLITE